MSELIYCHKQWCRKWRIIRTLILVLLIFVILVLFTILLIWLILRPSSPKFTLQDVTVYQFNVTPPNYLTSNIQLTISSRNPNGRIGIYYDQLDIYGTYRNQEITLPTLLPPTYEGHKDINVWSPFISGNCVPIAPYLATSLYQDQCDGFVLVNIKVYGKLRWKVGTWTSGHYRINVNCPAYLRFGNPGSGIATFNAGVKYTLSQSCSVDI